MFDIGWSELLVIAIVALIAVGPRDLPRMLRTFGRTIGHVRRMAGEFQSQFNEALREAELDDVRKDIDSVRNLNPLNQIRDEVKSLANTVQSGPADSPKTTIGPVAADPLAPGAAALAPPAETPVNGTPPGEPASTPLEVPPPPAHSNGTRVQH